MYLVNEQNDVRMFLHFCQNGTNALFKLSAIFGSGHYRCHVERNDALAEQGTRNPLLHDTERQSFGNGRFAHTRFTNQNRVVLLAPAQNLCDTLNFFFTAYHGVEFSSFGRLGQVDAVIIKVGRVFLRLFLFGLGCLAVGGKPEGSIVFVRVSATSDAFLFFVVIEIKSVKRSFLLLYAVYYFFVSYVILFQYLICVILVVSHNGQ